MIGSPIALLDEFTSVEDYTCHFDDNAPGEQTSFTT
jgi:hypothetical protein